MLIALAWAFPDESAVVDSLDMPDESAVVDSLDMPDESAVVDSLDKNVDPSLNQMQIVTKGSTALLTHKISASNRYALRYDCHFFADIGT